MTANVVRMDWRAKHIRTTKALLAQLGATRCGLCGELVTERSCWAYIATCPRHGLICGTHVRAVIPWLGHPKCGCEAKLRVLSMEDYTFSRRAWFHEKGEELAATEVDEKDKSVRVHAVIEVKGKALRTLCDQDIEGGHWRPARDARVDCIGCLAQQIRRSASAARAT